MNTKLKTINPLIKGTLILTLSGLISRALGFLYRIILSNNIGTQGMGLYQLINPISLLTFSFCTFGIQTAISKYVAEYSDKKDNAKKVYISGMLLSLTLSIITATVIYIFAPQISRYLLSDVRCLVLLRIVALSIPFSAIHSCTNAYCMGMSNAKFPALIQLAEQCVRIFFVYAICHIALRNNKPVTVSMCMAGLLAGELVSTGLCLLYLKRQNITLNILKTINYHNENKRIIRMAIPLSTSRIVLHFFQSLETVLLPGMLCLYGLSKNNALSTLGIVSGMAMPFILFPSTIASSYAHMLLPKVSSYTANNNKPALHKVLRLTMNFCITYGIFCLFVFLFFGHQMAAIMFSTSNISPYIKTLAFLCPFLYIDITLTSVLNGIKYAKLTFINNLFSLTIRLLFVIIGVRMIGIESYFLALLVSELLAAVICVIEIKVLTGCSFNIGTSIALSILSGIIAFGVSLYAYSFICAYVPVIFSLIVCCIIAAVVYWLLPFIRSLLVNVVV